MIAPIAIMAANPGAMSLVSHSAMPKVQFPHTQTLFDSMVANVHVSQRSEADVQLFTIEAKTGTLPIDSDTITGVFNATEDMINKGQTFKTLWNLRQCPVPSPSVVYQCLHWAIKKKRALDNLNVGMGIVLPANRPVILTIVNSVLRAFGPRCPVRATAQLEDAQAFLEALPAPAPGDRK